MRQRSVLKVYADRLENNLKNTFELGGRKKLIPMLKANAYGHDLSLVSHFIDKNFDDSMIDTLGVACIGEAEFLRKVVKVQKRIFVFSDFQIEEKKNQELMQDFGVIPVISNLDNLKIFLNSFEKFPLVLKFNTGMNRLGINSEELPEVIKLLKKNNKLQLEHVMSHFACSYLVGHEMNQKQMKSFESILSTLKSSGIEWKESSFFNSGALEQRFQFDNLTHHRPGLMLYGPQSTMTNKTLWDGEIVSDFETDILDSRNVKRGEFVGYGATEVPADGRLLVLPVGYGDGLLPRLQNFETQHQGQSLKFLGRINMDLASLWVSSISLEDQNKPFKLWDSNQNHFKNLVKHLGTHPYDVFCSITSRVPRKFLLKS